MEAILDIPLEYRLAALAAIGVCVGAAVNWAVYRFAPQRRRIGPWCDPDSRAKPGSWFDLVPILGWILLRRDSALHGRGYWVRPLLVEAGMGALFAGLYWWETVALGVGRQLAVPFEPRLTAEFAGQSMLLAVHLNYVSHVVLFSFMLAATLIDIDERTIPDALTVPGTLVGLWLAAIVPLSLPIDQARRMTTGGQVLDSLHVTAPLPFPNSLSGAFGQWPLMIGLACFWLWCFALLPRTWRMRRGLDTAITLFLGKIVRDPYSWLVGAMALVGSVGIWGIYRLGPPHWEGLLSALVGLAGSAAMVWAVRLIGVAVLGKEAMGFGDVTLMAMIGAFLGWQSGVLVFFAAPVLALAFGVIQLIRGQPAIPYGPFLCAAAAVVVVAWGWVWDYAQRIFALGWLIPGVLAACMVLLAVLLALLQGAKGLFAREDEEEQTPAGATRPSA